MGSIALAALLVGLQAGAARADDLWSRLSAGDHTQLLRSFDAPGGGRSHAALRFRGPLSPDQHRELKAAGIELLSYLGDNSYFASLPPDVKPGVGALATLIGSAVPDAEEKLDAALLEPRPAGQPPPWFQRGPDLFAVVVEFFSDVKPGEAQDVMDRASPRTAREGPTTWSVALSISGVRALAAEDEVKRIAPGPTPPLPLTEVQRVSTRTNEAQGVPSSITSPFPSYRVDGKPVRIGICDDGIDEGHDDFDEITPGGALGVTRIVPNDPTTSSVHGTQVASITAGSGYWSLAYPTAAFGLRGHAPNARLGEFAPFASQIDAVRKALVEHGMHLTNHSYAQSGGYDARAAELDRIIRGNVSHAGTPIPPRPQIWAAGNNGVSAQYASISEQAGYHSVYTTAKNSISVGSVNAPSHELSEFSSLGPTFDGRIKPDLVAPGLHAPGGIVGASAAYQSYKGDFGTSMAAPAVTGIIALLMHQIEKGGSAFEDLLPSTYKAILVQTAKDRVQAANAPVYQWKNPDTDAQVFFHAGPDFATGWGLVDAEAAWELVAAEGRWIEGTLKTSGASDEYCLTVAASFGPVKVTLAWDDFPGDTSTPETTSKLVNDLDLLLFDPNGSAVLPWTIDPPPLTGPPKKQIPKSLSVSDIHPAYRGHDHRNNVEMADHDAPAGGTWRARVTAHQLPMNKPQKYSLAGSHPIEGCP